MATTSVRISDPSSAKVLCRIVAIACIAGFLFDMLILGLPPAANNIEWRVGFMQQMSDRSIILLFGSALFMYSCLDSRRSVKRFAMFCLAIGIVFHLSCILVIRDSLTLQQRAVDTINQQAAQVRSQIEERKANPGTGTNAITPEQLQQASQAITQQVDALKESAKTGVLKTGFSSVGNLVVVGLAMIGLSRYGMRSRRSSMA
jgi:hypothetical protein